MKKRLALLLLIVLAGLAAVFPVQGQTTDFTIDGADATSTLGLGSNSTLLTLVTNLAPRFLIEYANQKKVQLLTPAPAALNVLVQQLMPRFVIEYANQKKVQTLVPLPVDLSVLAQQLAPRYVLEYANARRAVSLAYPKALIDDTTAPNLTSQVADYAGSGRIQFGAASNEYTTCLLEFGSSPGNYTRSLADPEFRFSHQLLVSGLWTNAPVYYRYTLTDRSGNNAQTEEYITTANIKVYLPSIRR